MAELPTLLALLALSVAVALGFRWRRARSAEHQRHQAEDALKHMFEEEYRGRRASLPSLAGILRIPSARVVSLVGRMQAQGLLVIQGQTVDLTPEGEKLALQVVRAHRLLERYFADEARLPLTSIHAAAERGEHALTPAAADRLSAALGHPTHDPHGDPIPTREGDVAPPAGMPVTAWPREQIGRIVHLEDEPELSYAQIVAAGLRVGQFVRIVDATPERVTLTDGENEYRLAPAVAANVFLTPAATDTWPDQTMRLSELTDQSVAEVVGLDEACQGFSRRRLMDLGFTSGARIRPFLKTFAGDPRAYDVRGTLIALRNDQAAYVLVRPIAQEAEARRA